MCLSIHTDGQRSRLFVFRLIRRFFLFVVICLDLPSIDLSICSAYETIVQDEEREKIDVLLISLLTRVSSIIDKCYYKKEHR
jgi:hypothetical protein